jgi:hypothetical protein
MLRYASIDIVDRADDRGISGLLRTIPSRGLAQAREVLGGQVELVTYLRLEQLANLVDLVCRVGNAGKASRGGARLDLAEAKDRRIRLQVWP